MLNRVILIGRLTADPHLRYTQNGTPVCTFRLAVDRNRTNQQGERETDFIDIVTWQKLAETCSDNLNKGRLVAVDGRLQIRDYEYEGQRRRVAEVVAENVRFLDWPREGAGGTGRDPGGWSREPAGYGGEQGGYARQPGGFGGQPGSFGGSPGSSSGQPGGFGGAQGGFGGDPSGFGQDGSRFAQQGSENSQESSLQREDEGLDDFAPDDDVPF